MDLAIAAVVLDVHGVTPRSHLAPSSCPGMATRATVNLLVRHCHGMRRQFKAKTLHISANAALTQGRTPKPGAFANLGLGADNGLEPDIAKCAQQRMCQRYATGVGR